MTKKRGRILSYLFKKPVVYFVIYCDAKISNYTSRKTTAFDFDNYNMRVIYCDAKISIYTPRKTTKFDFNNSNILGKIQHRE